MEDDRSCSADQEYLPTCLDFGSRLQMTSNGSSKFGNVATVEHYRDTMLKIGSQSKPALFYENRVTMFGELDELSTKVALAIRKILEHGLQNENSDGDWVIALCLPSTDQLIACIFAIHKLGAAYVPIDNTFPQNQVLRILTNCRPVLVISDGIFSTMSKFNEISQQTQVISVEELLDIANQTEVTDVIPFPCSVEYLADRIAVVLYTSGTSGTPKGVRINHKTIMNRLSWEWDVFPFSENENCCFKSVLSVADSVVEIFGPLLKGHGIHIFSKTVASNPSLLIRNIFAAQITRILLAPSLLRALIYSLRVLRSSGDHQSNVLDSIRLWFSSSETLPKEMLDEFFTCFENKSTSLVNLYGNTETLGAVSYEVFRSSDDIEKKSLGVHISIGLPICNTVLYILNNDLSVTPEGEIGELFVGGYNVCSGYVGIQNSEKFVDNPFSNAAGFNRLFRTGDFVRIGIKDGRQFLIYEGMSDSQIKINGHRIDLREIEYSLEKHSDLVSRVVVLCLPLNKFHKIPVAFIVPATKYTKQDSIESLAKSILKTYQIPKLKIVSDIPLLLNGKVDCQKLLANYKNQKDRPEEIGWNSLNVSPQELQRAMTLVEIIAEVAELQVRDVIERFDDSFYNLGGNSLNSVTVVTKLRSKQCYIDLDVFVDTPTLRELLPKISDAPPSTCTTRSDGKYYTENLSTANEVEATHIIATSFSRKFNLKTYINTTYKGYVSEVKIFLPALKEKGLSFIVRRRENQKAIAVAFNFDIRDQPDYIPQDAGIQSLLTFFEFLEAPLFDKLPQSKGQVLQNFLLGTDESVSSAENVPLVSFTEEQVIRVAIKKGFRTVFCTNVSPLTIQVCSDILGYETLVEFQVNQFKNPNGVRPFELAPDTQKVVCCLKKLDPINDGSILQIG